MCFFLQKMRRKSLSTSEDMIIESNESELKGGKVTGRRNKVTDRRNKLASGVYGSVRSNVKSHYTAVYGFWRAHYLSFTNLAISCIVFYHQWSLKPQNSWCFLINGHSGCVLNPLLCFRWDQPVLSPHIWQTHDSDVAASQNGTVRFIRASPWTLSFPFTHTSSYAIIF